VKGQDEADVLNEVKMLELMKGVPGVPQLEDYWLVEGEDGVVERTSDLRFKNFKSASHEIRTHIHLVLTPCARPLHKFQTKKELVKALRDIILSKYFLSA
jgi:hypothetical protein